jgi:tumor protein p53-inducible protein 3
MKAVLIKQPGDASQLYIGDYPNPEPADNEILVEVKATAVNRADISQRAGFYPSPKGASPLMGLEIAGVVVEVGRKVSKWKTGERVFGLLGGGGYAEFATISEDVAMPIPEGLSFEEAAAVPEVFLTAYQTLFWIGDLKEGERVLIHAGASGVGTAAIQMAKAKGAIVIVTAGSEEKLERCRHLGADLAINYKEGSFAEKINEVYGPSAVNVVLDFIGASYWEQNLNVLAMDGRHVLISTLGGAKLDHVDLRLIMGKRITLSGTTLRSRGLDYKVRLTRDFVENMLPLFAKGELHPVIDSVFKLEEIQEAHKYIEANKNIGKIILQVSQ